MVYFCLLEDIVILLNSADLDEMQHYASFHLCLHCFPKYPFRGFQYTKRAVIKKEPFVVPMFCAFKVKEQTSVYFTKEHILNNIK